MWFMSYRVDSIFGDSQNLFEFVCFDFPTA